MVQEISFKNSVSSGDEFLVVQFLSEISAVESIAALSNDVELVDFVSLANGGLSVFFRGKNLKKLSSALKKNQKKNFVQDLYKKSFPLDVLKIFYYLVKPKDFSSLIFAETKTIPEMLAVIEKCLELGLCIAEVRSQRSFAKNTLVIGANSQNYKKVFSDLKKNFKKAKWAGHEKPNESLLRMFVSVKPN